jgi:hypothetical protein
MSAAARDFVWRHSPYQRSTLFVHLGIADSVSDTDGSEFNMAFGRLARKLRLSRKHVVECIQQLVADGLLTLIEERPGGTNRYRFEFPDLAVVYDTKEHYSLRADGRKVSPQVTRPVGPEMLPQGPEGVTSQPEGVTSADSAHISKPIEPTDNQNNCVDLVFFPSLVPAVHAAPQRKTDEIWDTLMNACGIDGEITRSARGAYNRAVAEIRAIGASPDEIRQRASGFRARWPDASLTPTSLVRRWAECGHQASAAPRQDDAVDTIQRLREMEGRA